MRYQKRSAGGRRSVGERVQIATRVHPELATIIRDHADNAGLSVTQYMAGVMAANVGREDLLITQTDAQELPLTG